VLVYFGYDLEALCQVNPNKRGKQTPDLDRQPITGQNDEVNFPQIIKED